MVSWLYHQWTAILSACKIGTVKRKMSRRLFLIVVAVASSGAAFQTPFPTNGIVSSRKSRMNVDFVKRYRTQHSSRQSTMSGCRNVIGKLYVSSSTDKEKDEVQDLSVSATMSDEKDHELQWIESAVQGGMILAVVVLAYIVTSSVFAVAGDIAVSALRGLSDEFLREMNKVAVSLVSLLGTLIMATWDGLLFILPLVAKAVVTSVQAAIPVLKDASETLVEFAAPFVEEAKVEVAAVAAPYVDHLTDVVHQATDSTIVEPMHQLSRTVDTTIITPLQEAKDNLLDVVDATVVTPIQDVADIMVNAIDTNVVAPIQDVRDTVTDVMDTNIITPIQEAKESLETVLRIGVSTDNVQISNSLPVDNPVGVTHETSLPEASSATTTPGDEPSF